MPKILVIDDDKDFQEATRILLESNDFEIAAAYDAAEGLEKVKSEKPDLVILDVMMPGDFEGFEVARKIREDMKLRDLPVVLLTGVHEKKKVPYRFGPDEEWLPVDYFFDKPVEPDVLVSKIKEFLNITE